MIVHIEATSNDLRIYQLSLILVVIAPDGASSCKLRLLLALAALANIYSFSRFACRAADA